MRYGKLSDDAICKLFQQYCNGAMLKELADANGIHPKTLGSRFARLGLKNPRYAEFRMTGRKPSGRPPKKTSPVAECPSDCKYLMWCMGKNGDKRIMHCGYILFPENGSRGCDPGAECIRYEPKKRREG